MPPIPCEVTSGGTCDHSVAGCSVHRIHSLALRLNNALGSHRNQCGGFLRSFVLFNIRSDVRRREILPLCPVALRRGLDGRRPRDLKGATAPGQCAFLERHSPHPRPHLVQFHRPIPSRAVQINQSGMSMGVHTFFPRRRRCRRSTTSACGFSSTTWSRLRLSDRLRDGARPC